MDGMHSCSSYRLPGTGEEALVIPEEHAISASDAVNEFIIAACTPREGGHGSGTLARAEAILTAHAAVATSSIHTAAILGDDTTVRRFLSLDPANATAAGGPHGWDALTHLCFSRYLRLDHARTAGFVRAATALLDVGASANTGWMEPNHEPQPEWESAIYGAAGVARNPELTRLLLERGADPNDGETPYHAPESRDNTTLKILVESGKLTERSLATILLRKTDWHDYEAIKWLLDRGVNPNVTTQFGKTALHNAILSDNSVEIVGVLLDHGADPLLIAARPDRTPTAARGLSAVEMTAWAGRGDVLQLFEKRGIQVQLHGVERLLAACASNDSATVRSIADRDPHVVQEVIAEGSRLLSTFARVGNTEGTRQLLDLGIDVNAVHKEGAPYFGVARDSRALHSAAWLSWPATVKLLLERGATVDARDAKGRTPLALAVRACVDSFWTWRRSPETVELLLRAGASASNVAFPSGYAEVDTLLEARRK
jgi:ankyrin repeat protein